MLLSIVALLDPEDAFAGPPYVTDDPFPTEYKHFEIFLASEYSRNVNGKGGTLPHLEVNYGPAPDVQIGFTIPYTWNQDNGASRESGLGDIEVSGKYQFIHETKTVPAVAFFPSYKSHTGDDNRGLGTGVDSYFLPIWIGKNWGDWTSFGGAGYTITDAPDTKNTWFFAWALQKKVSETLSLGTEVFHETEGASGEGDSTGFNIAVLYDFSEHHHIVFSAGKGLQNTHKTNQFSSFLAYQLTF